MRAYATLCASLQNGYRRRGLTGSNTLAIAFAMSGLLLLNLWALVEILQIVLRLPIVAAMNSQPILYVFCLAALPVVEYWFVKRIQRGALSDPRLAAAMRDANPKIWIWYAVLSLLAFVAGGIGMAVVAS
jgi:hypothetical protein